jgi:type IV pilus assembly protein PilO
VEIAGIELNELEIENIGGWPLFVRIWIISGVFVVTLIAGYMIELSDQWNALGILQDKREELKKSFEIAQHKVANLNAYKQQVKLVEAELEKLTELLPQANEEAGLLEDISQKASSSSLQFVSIMPEKELSREFYIESPIQLTLSGSYQGMGEFVSAISNMQRIVTLHGFTIKRSNKEAMGQTAGTREISGEQPMKGPLVMTVQTKTYWAISNPTKAAKIDSTRSGK